MDNSDGMSLCTLKTALEVSMEAIGQAQLRIFLQNDKAVEDLNRALAYLRIVSDEAKKLDSLIYKQEVREQE